MKLPLYKTLSRKLRLLEADNNHYEQIVEHIEELIQEHFPSGSGFDSGCEIVLDNPKEDKIVVKIPYHCMNENGYYDGWIYPELVVTPSMSWDYNMRINFNGYNGKYKEILKDYFNDLFSIILEEEVEYKTINLL